MAKISAGILLFRKRPAGIEVLLVHPGGPFWAKKDAGAWSIPKGLADESEDLIEAAKREFLEETGMAVEGAFRDLGAHKQPGGKTVRAWAVEGDFDVAALRSNTFAARMAAAFGTNGRVPGGRPGGVVFHRRGAGEGDQGPEADRRAPPRDERILTGVAGWAGGPAHAMAWYRAEPIPERERARHVLPDN